MMASKAGADIRLNSKVEQLIKRSNSITGVSLSNGEVIKGNVFIDASGMNAVLAKQVSLHTDKTRAVFCSEYDMWTPNLPQSDIAEFYFGNNIAPSGYAWIFPWSKEHARVGVGIVQEDLKKNPLTYLKTFITEHKIASKKLKGAQPMNFIVLFFQALIHLKKPIRSSYWLSVMQQP
jgi:digeranylgeranylglycerophospholipid reductase